MTGTPSVEDRLRRAFRAVADQPVAVVGLGGEMSSGGRRSPARRRTGLVVAISAAVVVAIGTLALVYGPRSSAPGSRPPQAVQGGGAVAVYVPNSPTATRRQLAEDATVLTTRLASLGDATDTAVVQGRSIAVVGGKRLPVPASTLASSGTVDFRPALCTSAPFTTTPAPFTTPTPGGSVAQVPTACSSPEYSLKAPNLEIAVGAGSSNIGSIPLDPTLAAVPTSTPAYDESHPGDPVLVPLVGGGGERYLLGPAEMNGSAVARAQAVYQSPEWVVDATFTGPGATAWDELAHKYFHEIIAFDLDGQAISVPITEP